MIVMVVRRGRRLFPVRVLKQCGILAAGNWDLDHGNSLAKSGSYTQRRLTHHLVKAPYSGTEIGVFMFLSGRKFPRNRRFLDHSSKTGSDGAERFRVKSYVPLALSNGTWMRAVGLPVWAGHRQPCFFCLSVCTG
jgi:hypothetical protein